MAKWIHLFLYLAVLFAALFVVLEGIVLAGCRDEVRRNAPVMIVLGAKVRPDGPSPALQRRLDKAAEYLKDHPDVLVIVSGGQGSNEPMSEAQAMAEYLETAGVASWRIYREETSATTIENLDNSKILMEQMGYDLERTPVIVVSSSFHLARVRMLCNRIGLQADTLGASMTDASSAIYSYSREALALVKSFLLDGRVS